MPGGFACVEEAILCDNVVRYVLDDIVSVWVRGREDPGSRSPADCNE